MAMVHYESTLAYPPASSYVPRLGLNHNPLDCRWCKFGIPDGAAPAVVTGMSRVDFISTQGGKHLKTVLTHPLRF